MGSADGNLQKESMNAFESFYQTIYGDRWIRLKSALLEPAPKVMRDCFQGFAEQCKLSQSQLGSLSLRVYRKRTLGSFS